MKRRNLIAMTDEEIQAFLQEKHTMQIATIDHDGYPHLVAMWYTLLNNEVTFWTYAKAQKAVNLRRDPRLTCLVESGERYEELRGVQIKGRAAIIDDRESVRRIVVLLWERYAGPELNESVHEMLAAQAAKRIAVIVRPFEVVSWDHRKLGGAY
jgi:PPOX class probable F420-dependent enzyme